MILNLKLNECQQAQAEADLSGNCLDTFTIGLILCRCDMRLRTDYLSLVRHTGSTI